MRLYAIDEDYLVNEVGLETDGSIQLAQIEAGHGSLVMLGSVRSAAAGFDYAKRNKGDRLYHHFNGDSSENYRFQRLTGEGSQRAKTIIELDRFSRRIVKWLGRGSLQKPPSCIQDQSGLEKRFAWVPNSESEAGLFGVHAVFYPEYANERFFRSWMSFHGAKEGVWNPAASETGTWANRGRLRSICVFPRGGPDARGAKAVAGSREALYRTKGKKTRFVVPPEGARSVTLQVQSGGFNLNILVSGRSKAPEGSDGLLLTFNGDENDRNYIQQRVIGCNGSHSGCRAYGREFGILPGSSSRAGLYGAVLIAVPNYSAFDRQKQIFGTTGGLEDLIGIYGGTWKSDDAIASITLSLVNGEMFEIGSVIEVWVNEHV